MIEMRYVDSGLWSLPFKLLVRGLIGILGALNPGLRDRLKVFVLLFYRHEEYMMRHNITGAAIGVPWSRAEWVSPSLHLGPGSPGVSSSHNSDSNFPAQPRRPDISLARATNFS